MLGLVRFCLWLFLRTLLSLLPHGTAPWRERVYGDPDRRFLPSSLGDGDGIKKR